MRELNGTRQSLGVLKGRAIVFEIGEERKPGMSDPDW